MPPERRPADGRVALRGPEEPRWLVALWTFGPAAVPLLLGILGVAGGGSAGARVWWGVAAVATAVVVAARLRRPVACWVGSLLVVASGLLQGVSGVAVLLAFVPVLPLAALTAERPPRASLGAAGVTLVATVAVSAVLLGSDGAGGFQAVVLAGVVPGTLVLAAWLIGYALFVRGRYAEALVDRARTLERERDTEAARAVAEERTRIARDLHDVVSHNVSVMLVQATAADAVWDDDPARARDAVRAVQDTGRTAMGELRSMLRAMRGDDDEAAGAERRAQEGIERLPALVEQVRSTGLDARLDVRGDLARVDPVAGVSLLRIAQEALTNVLRHAAAGRVDVAVDVGADAVGLTIEDDGRGLSGTAGGDGDLPPVVGDRGLPTAGVVRGERIADGADRTVGPTRRGGHGLIGMRERVAVLDGTLEVGPGAGGGTRVAATVPLRQDAAR